MAIKKKPTPAQPEARRLFAARARAGEFKKNPKRRKAGGMVKILGFTVRKGSKRHSILTQQKRHFDDLGRSETGKGRKNPCTYCGGGGVSGFVKGPDHSTVCPRYIKPKRRVLTIGRKKNSRPPSPAQLAAREKFA